MCHCLKFSNCKAQINFNRRPFSIHVDTRFFRIMTVECREMQGNAGWSTLTSLDGECGRRYVQNLCCFDSSLWLRLHA